MAVRFGSQQDALRWLELHRATLERWAAKVQPPDKFAPIRVADLEEAAQKVAAVLDTFRE